VVFVHGEIGDALYGVVPRDAFLKLLEQERNLSSHFMILLCRRIRWISEIVEDEAFRSVPMCLARRVAVVF
jgi:hypothetical protein